MELGRQIIFLANIPFELFGTEGKLKEFGAHTNQIVLSSLPVIDESFDFVFNKVTKQVETYPVIDNIDLYEHIKLHKSLVTGDQQLEPYETHHINDTSRKYEHGIYFADSYMRGYLNGRPVEVNIGGDVPFTLDIHRELYYETDHPENIINLADLINYGFGYEVDFDPVTKNLHKEYSDDRKPHFLDEMVSYEPLGMAKKYSISIGRLPEYDSLLKEPKVLEECRRFTGKLPLDSYKEKVANNPMQKKEKSRKHRKKLG